MHEYTLSIVLLILSFVTKLFVNRSFKVPSFLKAIAELPVDMMFLSAAMVIPIIKFMMMGKGLSAQDVVNDVYNAFGLFIWYIVWTIIVTAIWRFSEYAFDKERKKLFTLCVGIEYLISVIALLRVLSLLGKVVN